jgi:3-hydroxyisobutyrate dehydrogenase
MCGGDPEDYERVEPLIVHYSRMRKLLGPAGSGQLAKMVNQIAIAGLVQGLAEAIHFGMRADLPMEQVIEVISKGAAGSWQMENRYKTMIAGKFDFGFAVDWMRKDLGMCIAEAKANGAHLPVTALVDQFYGEVQEMGGRRWDTSSLIARFERPPR